MRELVIALRALGKIYELQKWRATRRQLVYQTISNILYCCYVGLLSTLPQPDVLSMVHRERDAWCPGPEQ